MSDMANDLAMALNPVKFAADKLGLVMDPWQAELLNCDTGDILVNVCRQAGKSTATAIKALHRAHYSRGTTVLILAPGLRQSSELFRKVREFEAKLGGADVIETESAVELSLRNGSRVCCLPGGNPSSIRGFSSPDLIIVDEAAHVEGSGLFVAIRPMLAISRGQLILLSTPAGRTGYFFEAFTYGGPEWKRIQVTAENIPRISPAFLAHERASLTEAQYSAEYECQFVSMDGALWNTDTVMAAVADDLEPWYPDLIPEREIEESPCFESLA
jgi:hypothetical protein